MEHSESPRMDAAAGQRIRLLRRTQSVACFSRARVLCWTSMELLLVKYGYVLLFLGVAIEGEAFLIAASFLAHRGTLHLPMVILVAVASNCAADQIYYVMAR